MNLLVITKLKLANKLFHHAFKEEIKGNCDAELVLHTMIEYENYDKAVIVSGDGDFHCLVEYLEEENKLKQLIIPNQKSYSSLLKKFGKHGSFLNGLQEKIGK